MAAGIPGSLSPWKPQAGLTQVCHAGAKAGPLCSCQLPPAPLPTPTASQEAARICPAPALLAPLHFQWFLLAPHPRILQEAHLCSQRVLLEASELTVGGRVRGLALGLTLPQPRRQVLGKWLQRGQLGLGVGSESSPSYLAAPAPVPASEPSLEAPKFPSLSVPVQGRQCSAMGCPTEAEESSWGRVAVGGSSSPHLIPTITLGGSKCCPISQMRLREMKSLC